MLKTTNPEIVLHLPKLFESQKVIRDDATRFKVLCCGRRYGKTYIAKNLIPRQLAAGLSVSFMTPVYKTLEEVWEDIKRYTLPLVSGKDEMFKVLNTSTNGKLECWSLLHPNRIRSRGYDYIYVDEAAFVPDLLNTWNKVLRPMLADRLGGAMFMSSPRSYNDFYALYQLQKTDAEWKSFHHATWDNPHINADEIEKIRASMPQADFDQEYGALFQSRAGLVYDTWSDGNITPDAIYNPDLPVLWGVDDGYVNGDGIGTKSYHPRVITFGQVYPDGSVTIFDEYVATQELPEKSIDNALALPYQLPYTAYIDSSAQELKARIWSRGVQTVNATHKVSDGIDLVRRYICDGNGVRLLKVHPKCVNLIHDMEHYAYEKNQLGEIKPSKLNDNSADSLRYLLYSLRYDS